MGLVTKLTPAKGGGVLKPPSNYFSKDDNGERKFVKKKKVQFSLNEQLYSTAQYQNKPSQQANDEAEKQEQTKQALKIRVLSPWTLKLSSPQMQADFSLYLREQAQGYAKILSPILLVFSIIAFLAAILLLNDPDDEDKKAS